MSVLYLFYGFILFVLASLFFIGIVLLIIGLLEKKKRNSETKTGLIFISIPLGFFLIAILYEFMFDKFAKKPSEKDLVGVYHITSAKGLIPKEFYRSYKLELKNDRTFYLTPTPYINVCEQGNYSLDYQFNINELSFQCKKGFTPAHIKRGFSGFNIEFIQGDPDRGESICFTKDK